METLSANEGPITEDVGSQIKVGTSSAQPKEVRELILQIVEASYDLITGITELKRRLSR